MLHVNDLTYRIGDRLILDSASFNLPTGAKVGLVGRNGAGKTTLFKIIQGELATESGSVTLPRGMKIGAVAQEAPGNVSVGSEVAATVSERVFYSLEAPVLRVSGFDAPFPPAKLESVFLPDADRILDAVDRALAY